MKQKEIQEILDFIAHSGLDEVNIETEQFKLSVKRNSGMVAPTVVHAPVAIPQVAHQAAIQTLPPTPKEVAPFTSSDTPNASEGKYITIKSPMIGTFYRSSGPDSDAFVNAGDMVNKGTTVCIIEAMKLFNEIESDISGKIVKILVENATPVEYDQPLFLIDPS